MRSTSWVNASPGSIRLHKGGYGRSIPTPKVQEFSSKRFSSDCEGVLTEATQPMIELESTFPEESASERDLRSTQHLMVRRPWVITSIFNQYRKSVGAVLLTALVELPLARHGSIKEAMADRPLHRMFRNLAQRGFLPIAKVSSPKQHNP